MSAIQKSKLRLLGRVSTSILKKIYGGTEFKKPRTEWFFVDYSSASYKVRTVFDIFIEGGGKDWNHDYKIKLLKITDEFGSKFDEIPKGYKTICCFQFTPKMPNEIKALPVLSDWDVKEQSIYLLDHTEINLMNDRYNYTLIFQSLLNLVWKELKHRKNKSFKVEDIAQIMSQDYNNNKYYIRDVADYLILSGKAKEKEEDRFEVIK